MADSGLTPDEQAALDAAAQGKPLPGLAAPAAAPAAPAAAPSSPSAAPSAGALSPAEEQALTQAQQAQPATAAPGTTSASAPYDPWAFAHGTPAMATAAFMEGRETPAQQSQQAAVQRAAINPDIAGPAIMHGLRTAVNPLLEWGSNLGNRLAAYDPSALGWLATSRAANDAANQQAWNAQLQKLTPAQAQAAQGVSAITGVAAPFAIGGAAEKGIQLGATMAGAPEVGAFLTGQAAPSVAGSTTLGRGLSLAAQGVTQGLATGGGAGATTGAFLGPLAGMAGSVVNGLAQRFGSGDTSALQSVYQQMLRDGMTPQQMATSLQALGPLGTVADIAEPNLSRLAEGIANNPGAGQAIAYRNLVNRNLGQSQRMVEATNRATGGTATAAQTNAQLIQARSAAAAPAYDNAFNNTRPSVQDEGDLADFVQSPIGQRAFQTGMAEAQINDAIARSRGQMGAQNLAAYGVQQNPDGTFARIPGQPITMQGLDAIKKGYDRMVEGFRDPTTGRINYSGEVTNVPGMAGNVSVRTLDNMRNAFTDQLRSRFPLYADALDTWAGPSQAMDAISLGKRVLTNDDDVTAQNIANISPANRDMFATGVRDALTQKILSVQDRADAANRLFGNQLIRNKIAAGMGGTNSPQFQQFEQEMERERTFWNTSNQMQAGSPTARRVAAQAVAQQATQGPTWGAILSPMMTALQHPIMGAAHLFHMAGPQLQSWISQPSERASAALGNYLFTPGGGQQLINRLQAGVPPTIGSRITGAPGQQGLQSALRFGGLYQGQGRPGGVQ